MLRGEEDADDVEEEEEEFRGEALCMSDFGPVNLPLLSSCAARSIELGNEDECCQEWRRLSARVRVRYIDARAKAFWVR